MKTYSFAKLSVTGFPNVCDLDNKWIFPQDVKVIVNVSGNKYPKDVEEIISRRGIKTYHFPLVEEGPDMGINNILSTVKILQEADAKGDRVILHCTCGNNRSRTVAEVFHLKKTGSQFVDEYKGFANHLVYNVESGHLPDMSTIENLLSLI